MNPWKEIVVSAHDLLDRSDQVATSSTSMALVVRLRGLLQELTFVRDLCRVAQGDLALANRQLERQAQTIASLQPKPEPPSEVPPSPTVEQFNAKVVEEVERRTRTRRKKRRDEGI